MTEPQETPSGAIPEQHLLKAKLFSAARISVRVQNDARHWKLGFNGIVMGYWPNTGTCYIFGQSFKPKTVEALIEAILSGRIKMPEDADQGLCKRCQHPIWWITNKNRKRIPLDTSGEAHFDCSGFDRLK